ncbi:MAG: shikimate kinase [Bryobacterales bacterium]|jgi:shikimate kinase|nr:shikimate kinase [Bryobacterales bacterium]
MILKLKRTPGIFLVGFMGSGKSTVGRALAEELGWGFADLDQDIETRERMPITQIFDTRGEAEFRRAETAALRERVRSVEAGRPCVIALGGGALLTDENFQMVSNNGVTVWLDCSFATVERRLAGYSHRPLARDPEKLRELFAVRRSGYERADYCVVVENDDAAATAAKILALPLF